MNTLYWNKDYTAKYDFNLYIHIIMNYIQQNIFENKIWDRILQKLELKALGLLQARCI